MKKTLTLLAALMLMVIPVCCGAFAETETPHYTLPIDLSGGMKLNQKYFISDTEYEDPTIHVKISTGDVNGVLYWIADVEIADASQLRTAAAEEFDSNGTEFGSVLARRMNAVLAINGDFYCYQRAGTEVVIRQGIAFQDHWDRTRVDVLAIDEDGDFHGISQPAKMQGQTEIDGKKIINAFCFGPVLVEDGEIPGKMPNFTFLKPEEYYSRLALCQIGPLHYKVIITTMIQDYTLGLQIDSFAQLCKDEGAVIAYNLDGGYSATLYFHGSRLNSQKNINFREVPDIFYFASAWNGGDAE